MPTRRRLDAATGAEARLRRAAALVTLVAWHAVDFGVFASTEEGGGRLERRFGMETEAETKAETGSGSGGGSESDPCVINCKTAAWAAADQQHDEVAKEMSLAET